MIIFQISRGEFRKVRERGRTEETSREEGSEGVMRGESYQVNCYLCLEILKSLAGLFCSGEYNFQVIFSHND